MKAILYTSTRCPKCPTFRKMLRESAKELNWVEGKDFVEKLIDGDKVSPGSRIKLEGQEYYIVDKAENIRETPAALGGTDYTIEALQFQVASTPALIINQEIAFIGQTPNKKELTNKLKEAV
jgi:hypothetical protein